MVRKRLLSAGLVLVMLLCLATVAVTLMIKVDPDYGKKENG